MDQSSGFMKVDKLTADNFHVWRQKIKLVLSFRELDEFIDNDATPPTDEAARQSWTKKDSKAMAIIGLSLSESHLEHVSGVETALQMWKAVMDIFERHTLLNKLGARRKFYTVTMTEDESMLSFITRVKHLASTVKSMNVTIDDAEIAMALFNGLPDRFDNLISALDALGNEDETFTLDFIKSRVLQEEQRMKMRRDGAIVKAETEALVAALVTGGGRRPKCDHCGKLGHLAECCFKKFPHLIPSHWPQSDGSRTPNAAHVSNGYNAEDPINHFCLTSVSDVAGLTDSSIWIVDSACTSHMTFDRSAFVNYRQMESSVRMGTTAKATTAGIGDIIVHTIVNGIKSHIKLVNVLHIPTFRCQLISVPKITQHGGCVIFKNSSSSIEVAGRTVASGSPVNDLFHINTTVSSLPAGLSAYLSHSTSPSASLQLWHERLALVNKSGIAHMARTAVVTGINLDSQENDSDPCHGCVYGKGHNASIPKASTDEGTSNDPTCRTPRGLTLASYEVR